MQRRDFITFLGGAVAAWPLAARAQQAGRVRRIGMLFATPDMGGEFAAVVREALARLGWIEGRNVRIELRLGDSDPERLRVYADELVRLAPDVIFASGNVAARALQMRTQTIPIVFVGAGAVVQGNTTVKNITRPESNLTGFANKDEGIEGKWMQLLKEVAPRLARVNFIYADSIVPEVARREIASVEAAARPAGVAVISTSFHDATTVEAAIEGFAQVPNGGLIVNSNIVSHRDSILRSAAERKLPLISSWATFTSAGGLISYGVDPASLHREAADYIDRILRGAKPRDLPVQLPTKYDLAINLRTAKALGLTVPPDLLTIADKVIE
jgi:putative ABC transport system substrate-binding protein